MPLDEKEKILEKEYYSHINRYGFITSAVHVLLIFLPAVYVYLVMGRFVRLEAFLTAFATIFPILLPIYFIEPISYFTVLGVAGTYISFLAGNISNMRLPVGAIAQESADVELGSPEGELVGGLGIIASQLMLTVISFVGALVCVAIIRLLPQSVKVAFKYVLPAMFGAMFAQFGPRAPRYAAITLVLTFILEYFIHIPGPVTLLIACFGIALLATALYRRGIWVKR